MFGRRKKKDTSGRLGAFLDEGSEIEGKYTCSGTVMLAARLRGELTAKDKLVIGEQGVVHASVTAATVVVHGEVVGDVTAAERVELKKTARVTGDIEAPIIVMEEGAVHDGACRMAKARSAGPSHPVVVPLQA
jgi:cytoskeletal protein CcmA (bactofilin family)